MVDDDALRALALALPGVEAGGDPYGFSVGGKALAWAYLARSAPKAKRVRIAGIIAIRCTIETRDMLIEAAPERFFTDDHYRGYPAVLVRLDATEAAELEGLLRRAWRIVAPKAVVKRWADVTDHRT